MHNPRAQFFAEQRGHPYHRVDKCRFDVCDTGTRIRCIFQRPGHTSRDGEFGNLPIEGISDDGIIGL